MGLSITKGVSAPSVAGSDPPINTKKVGDEVETPFGLVTVIVFAPDVIHNQLPLFGLLTSDMLPIATYCPLAAGSDQVPVRVRLEPDADVVGATKTVHAVKLFAAIAARVFFCQH